MTYKLTVLAVLAAAGTWAVPALAITTNWGPHDALEVATARTPVGDFEDLYLFSLSAEKSLMSTSVSNNLGAVLRLDDGQVSLFKENGDADVSLGSYALTGESGNISFPFGLLDAGSYYYRVTGEGKGSAGGFYTLSSSVSEVSPVPEPNTVALMLAGFAGMGFLLRRRNQEAQ